MISWFVAFDDAQRPIAYRGKLCDVGNLPKGQYFNSLDEARELKIALNRLSPRRPFAIFGRLV